MDRIKNGLHGFISFLPLVFRKGSANEILKQSMVKTCRRGIDRVIAKGLFDQLAQIALFERTSLLRRGVGLEQPLMKMRLSAGCVQGRLKDRARISFGTRRGKCRPIQVKERSRVEGGWVLRSQRFREERSAPNF